MAHVYLMTRMPQWVRDTWLANMRSASSNWKREILDDKGKPTGKFENTRAAWNIKPIEFWEVVVPEESVSEVLWYNGVYDGKQASSHSKYLDKIAFPLRKALKLEKVDKWTSEHLAKQGKELIVEPRLIYREGATIYGLGVKRDVKKEFPQWGYKQEAL